jgi:hypothetical protein
MRFYTVVSPPTDTRNSHYVTHRSPLKALALTELPLEAVMPKGWLRDQILTTAEGLSGRLEEVSTHLREGNGWLDPSQQGWEEAPYWLRGIYDVGALSQTEGARHTANRYIEAAFSSQDEDGYFGPIALKRMTGKNGQVLCDLFPHTLMMTPIIHHYERTEDKRVAPFLERFFKFCANLGDQFIPPSVTGNFGWGGKEFGNMRAFLQYVRAGEMIPAIHWLYDLTGEAWLLDLSRRFFQAIRPAWDEWLDHHAVNYPNRFAYAATYYPQSGEPWHLDSAEYWYRQHMETWGQMPGGIFAADERIRPGCTDPRFGFETCGMIELAKSFGNIGRISGNSVWAERTEEIMYNHFPATHSPDLKAVHYVTAANQPILSGAGRQLHRNNGIQETSYVGYTAKNRCCGHNAGYGWPVVIKNLWQATSDDGLCLWIYGPCEVTARVAGKGTSVSIETETDYPFSGKVRLIISTKTTVRFPLYLRVPQWCTRFRVALNGHQLGMSKTADEYVVIDREFSDKDTVDIEMEMKTAIKRWPRNGSASVRRGPLWYSLRIDESWRTHPDLSSKTYIGKPEWPNWEVLPTSPWNYGLVLDNASPGDTSEGDPDVDSNIDSPNPPLHDTYPTPWTTAHAPTMLKATGKRIPNWRLQNDCFVGELQQSPIASDEPEEEITLIPLGCARLRISSFPVIGDDDEAREWKPQPESVDPKSMPPNRFDAMYPRDEADQ